MNQVAKNFRHLNSFFKDSFFSFIFDQRIQIGNERSGMALNADKFLCCMFLFSFFGLDRAKNTIVVYSVLRH